MLSHCQMREQMFTFCFVCLCYIETNAAVLCFIWRKCCSGSFFSYPHPPRLNLSEQIITSACYFQSIAITLISLIAIQADIFEFSQDSVQTNTWNKKILKIRGVKHVRAIACCINSRKLILSFIMSSFFSGDV